ncbi:MAG: hypothetical protein QM778_31930 [Myxococcales bacterium]
MYGAPTQAAPAPYAPAPYATAPGYATQPDYNRPPPGTVLTTPGQLPARPPRISRGLMIGGIVTLGTSYLIAALTGAILLDIEKETCRNCQQVGAFMFIPVFGPFLAIGPAQHAPGWLALYGAIELGGAVMMVAGIVKYTTSKRRREEFGYASIELPRGRSLSFDVAVSPQKLGPQLALRF